MNKYLVVADQILRNAVMGLPPVSRWRSRQGRTAPVTTRVDAAYLERYAYAPFDLVAGAVGDSCDGLTIGEIGPGDHIPAALLFLGDGAERYVAFDRFAGAVDDQRAREVYRALGRDLCLRRPRLARGLEARGIDPDRFPAGCADRARHVACAFEQADEIELAPLDVIFSHNVIEHVFDVERIATNAWILLRPGGVTVHRVDFGPHNPWRQRANPFEWLTVPEATWRMMGSQRGIPNRKRFHEVVASFEHAGFEMRAEVVERFGREVVDAMRPTLAAPFRDMPPESLDVKTAIIVGLKA